MKFVLFLSCIMFLSVQLLAQDPAFLTHYEKSQYLQTPRYAETS